MTYQSFDIEQALGADDAIDTFHETEFSELTSADFDAVEIARRDGPRSADPNSLVVRLARIFFGVELARPLASERLEKIRRFSVRAWFWNELREKDLRQLFDLGFSSNDIWRLIAYVGERRGFIPEIESWPA